jgi:hypothetical protein
MLRKTETDRLYFSSDSRRLFLEVSGSNIDRVIDYSDEILCGFLRCLQTNNGVVPRMLPNSLHTHHLFIIFTSLSTFLTVTNPGPEVRSCGNAVVLNLPNSRTTILMYHHHHHHYHRYCCCYAAVVLCSKTFLFSSGFSGLAAH